MSPQIRMERMSGQIQAGAFAYAELIGRTKNKCLANPVILYQSSMDRRDFGIVAARIKSVRHEIKPVNHGKSYLTKRLTIERHE